VRKLKPKYSIIIVATNQTNLDLCLKSVRENTGGDYEIIVVGHSGIRKGYFWNNYFQKTRYILSKEKLSFALSVNAGMMKTRKVKENELQLVIVLHDDTIVSPMWNVNLFEGIKTKPMASCIGPLTCSSNSDQALKSYEEYKVVNDIRSVAEIQSEVTREYTKKVAPMKISSFCFLIHRVMWDFVGEFEDLPEDICLTEWIIRAAKNKLHPFVDTSVYVHHRDNGKFDLETTKKGLLKIKELHGIEASSFIENELYLKLKR